MRVHMLIFSVFHLRISISPFRFRTYAYDMQEPVCNLSSYLSHYYYYYFWYRNVCDQRRCHLLPPPTTTRPNSTLAYWYRYRYTQLQYLSTTYLPTTLKLTSQCTNTHTQTHMRQKRTEKLILFNEIILLHLLCFRHEFRWDDRKCSRMYACTIVCICWQVNIDLKPQYHPYCHLIVYVVLHTQILMLHATHSFGQCRCINALMQRSRTNHFCMARFRWTAARRPRPRRRYNVHYVSQWIHLRRNNCHNRRTAKFNLHRLIAMDKNNLFYCN